MAVPNTMTSDLDRTDATIALFAAHLQQFSQECEQPHSKPGMREALQQLRLDEVNEYLDKIRKDLDSVRGHFQSSVANSEQYAADRKAELETMTQAIKFAEGQASEAKEEKKEAKEEKKKAKEKKAKAEEKEKAAESKRINVEKRAEEVAKREEQVKKREERVEKREERVEKREERVEKREERVEKREERLESSTGKRPLSSGVEPTSKRARSVGQVLPTGSPLDKEPGTTVSGIQLIVPPRSQLSTTVTPGPSGSSNEPSLLDDLADIYGLRPGSGICPDGLRDTNDEIQRTWAQIAFGAEWTEKDSDRLLEMFNKYAAKGVLRQMPQNCLDRCASAEGSGEKCLLQDMAKIASNWNEKDDATTQQCVHCSKKAQFCIRVTYVDLNPGEYDKDATNEKRWNITKRQL